jgi:hypothetical protein
MLEKDGEEDSLERGAVLLAKAPGGWA